MTLQEIYNQIRRELTQAEVEDASFDGMCLFEAVFSMDRRELILHREEPADGEKCQQVLKLTRRRCEGVPLQYLLGRWEFMGFEFSVGEGVLIPREDTEVLVREGLAFLQKQPSGQPLRVLVLCAGSGTVCVSIQRECPRAKTTAVELSEVAMGYLRENIRRAEVEVAVLPWDILSGELPELPLQDAILSNPPYLTAQDMRELSPEVQKEPVMALDGGEDGLRFYRGILRDWLTLLKPGGLLAVECGMGQGKELAEMFRAAGLGEIRICYDLNGIDRVVCGINFPKI